METAKRIPKPLKNLLAEIYTDLISFARCKKDIRYIQKIINVMSIIDRKFFVKDSTTAYENLPHPIGFGQTISQPTTVARMLFLLKVSPGNDVLEVGSGSGWNAALLALLAYPGEVKSIERIPQLKEKASRNVSTIKKHLKRQNPKEIPKLSALTFSNENFFDIKKGDYDRIIFTAGISRQQTEKRIYEAAKKFLRSSGKIIAPYASGPIVIYEKNKNHVKISKSTEQYFFVPIQ